MSRKLNFNRKTETVIMLNNHKTIVPKFCECGGELEYAVDFGRIFSSCLKCTPTTVATIRSIRTRVSNKEN